ncbi:hypothetical protein CV944_10485 [Geobacillus sp. WSUCF-018B]|nr:hypothetical protein CV944_10485 [Geobacillus sp. WSUCF-018B]
MKEAKERVLASLYAFGCEDPLGREVRLKSTTWNYHIVGGDHTREEFIGQEDMVKSVIQDPCFILPNNPDDQHDTRQKYIDLVQLPKFKSLKALVVIVDHEDEAYGDVVTVIAKSRLNQETGGAIYVRPKFTGKR